MRTPIYSACLGIAVLGTPLYAQDVGRFYSQSDLASTSTRIAPNLRGLWNEDFLTRLTPAERLRAGTVTLHLPLVGALRTPLNFYANPPARQVFVPIASVKFLDDVSIAMAYYERKGCGIGTVSDYMGVLREQPTALTGSPRESLGVPANALDDSFVDDLSQKLTKSIVFFIVAHEYAHVMYGHRAYSETSAQEAQRQETQADTFALEVMRRIAVPPLSMVHFFALLSRLERSPADFDTPEQYEAYLRLGASHPVSARRILAIADALETNAASYVITQKDPKAWELRILDAARQLREIGNTLDDRAMRRFLTHRARTLDPASLRAGCG